MRFDDTNPSKEESAYVESIMRDVKWLGFDWGKNLYYASDYFDQLYEYAVRLIQLGKAYVCDLTGEQIREYRGTLTEPGRESPFRNRSVEENLDLFTRMRAGEFPDGACTLRMTVEGLPSVVRWVLGFGHHAKPLAPPELVAQVKAEACAVAKMLEE